MAGATVTLEPADGAYVERLLAENGLPTADVRSTDARFYAGYNEGTRIGIGGFETYGTDGLLRSVVVEASARGAGVGTALCAALETTASADGVETIYLLTTTAAEFFANRGYEAIDRESAPAAIRGTTEFEELCPASATCMRKSM